MTSLNASSWRLSLSNFAKAAGFDGLAQLAAPKTSTIEIKIEGPLTEKTRQDVLDGLKTVFDMARPEEEGVKFVGHHEGEGMSVVASNGSFSIHLSLGKKHMVRMYKDGLIADVDKVVDLIENEKGHMGSMYKAQLRKTP